MKINTPNLQALRVGFQTLFQGALVAATALSPRIATEIPSTTKEERLGWLGKVPNVREWVGDRVINGITESDYTLKNKDWELTIGVDRNDIEDDSLGTYNPLFSEMGQSTGAHREQLIWNLLKAGFSTNCWDGQYFFDTDHPMLAADGSPTTYANTDGGSGAGWYLVCSKRVVKPIVWTNRKPWTFIAKDNPEDPNVFMKKEFLFGSDARYNVGYGLPQMAWGSKQTLDAAHYATGRAAITNMVGDYGRSLGLVPDLLVVGASNEGAARQLMTADQISGTTNQWKGTAEVLVVPWLNA